VHEDLHDDMGKDINYIIILSVGRIGTCGMDASGNKGSGELLIVF